MAAQPNHGREPGLETHIRTARALTAHWAEQAFSDRETPVRSDALLLIHDDAPGTAKVNLAAAGMPMRLGDRTYRRGIGVNALTVLRVVLSRPADRLLSDIGLDRNVDDTTPASVRFRVSAGGKELLATPVLRPKDGVRSIDVPLGGATEFEMTVDDGGDGRGWDQGDWADARVVLQDGRTLWLDDLARKVVFPAELPFSFVYGGKPSSDLLPTWKPAITSTPERSGIAKRVLTLTDPETGLEVQASARIYTDTGGVDWTLRLTNRGDRPTPIIEQVRAVDTSVTMGPGANPTLHRLHGSAVGVHDWTPIDTPLAPGKPAEFGSVAGRTSGQSSPFFTIDWGTGGVITAIGWSGHWSAHVEQHDAGRCRITAGMQQTRISLRPGESFRSPRILQLYWSGCDRDDAHNLFRRTMLAHVMPRIGGKPVLPPIAHLSTSFYEMNATTEANTLAHLEAVRGLGFEVFWLDAYWTRDGFPDGMGHYTLPLSRAEPPDRFPRGVRPIGEAAHRAGMKFLLWFEPERVAAGTHIAREHPEWVISPAGDGSGLLDLGLPEAREHITRYLDAAIREYGIDWLRIDYNINPLPFWEHRNARQPDRIGIAEIRYVEGLYRLWDDLRALHPGLAIDNCASGGTRIDLETCSRAVPLWRTDDTIGPLLGNDYAQSAIQNQSMSAGLNRYVPYSVSGQMGVTPYLFRSGFNGGIAYCEDCRSMGAMQKRLLAQAIAEGTRIRKYWLGDFYPISPPLVDAKDWCVMQFHRAAEDDGVVLGFRRHGSPYAAFAAQLRHIDPGATYSVTRSFSYRPGKPETMKGTALRRLRIDIDECPGSVILEYRRNKP